MRKFQRNFLIIYSLARETDRRLKDEQDWAFTESLKMDEEKARIRRQEEELKELEVRAEQEKLKVKHNKILNSKNRYRKLNFNVKH